MPLLFSLPVPLLTRRAGLAGALALLLSLAACTSDTNPPVAPADPNGPVLPPTPYVLNVPTTFPALPAAPADNPLTVEGVALGRQLFYEPGLSVDNSVSCASCHRQGLAFSDGLARAQGVQGGRTPRSAMALTNLAWEPALTWDGAAATLETQARIPIENPVEMHQSLAAGVARLQAKATYPPLFRKAFGSSTLTEATVLKALAQFERTLVSGNSRYDQFRSGNRTVLSTYEQQGLVLFNTHPDGTRRGGNCGDCHSGELFTDHNFRNNGLDATFTDLGRGSQTGLASDNGKFRVPSLRNVALTAPYMHDGRFATLEAVVDHYNEHVAFSSPNLDPLLLNTTNDPTQRSFTLDLTADEKAKIVAFLRTLTDTTFTRDPRFSKP
ncbi:MAG: cytochrome-c peroxidase [Bacteroidota bacterium]|nr:cytochrome-c peroxidase [Bacteroidota bacterium]